jgi:hypothetical protein
VVLQLEGWAWGLQLFTVKNKLVTKSSKQPQTWKETGGELLQILYWTFEFHEMLGNYQWPNFWWPLE